MGAKPEEEGEETSGEVMFIKDDELNKVSREHVPSRTLCLLKQKGLVDILGYQPNFHTKCMHFGWQCVLYCLAKIFAQWISLVTSQGLPGTGW